MRGADTIVGIFAYLCAYDRQGNGGPHLRCRQYRGYCRRLRHAPTQGRELRGVLSVPQREDAVVRRFALEGGLQVLRMRKGRECRDLPDGAREPDVPRGAEDGGQTLRHRGAREGAFGGGGAPQRRPGVDVRPERLGRGVLRQLPAARKRGHQHRDELLPPEARPERTPWPRATSRNSSSRRACRWSATATDRSTTASATG